MSSLSARLFLLLYVSHRQEVRIERKLCPKSQVGFLLFGRGCNWCCTDVDVLVFLIFFLIFCGFFSFFFPSYLSKLNTPLDYEAWRWLLISLVDSWRKTWRRREIQLLWPLSWRNQRLNPKMTLVCFILGLKREKLTVNEVNEVIVLFLGNIQVVAHSWIAFFAILVQKLFNVIWTFYLILFFFVLNANFFFVLKANTRSSFIESLERRQSEENAIVHALFTYFGNKLLLDDKSLFSRAVDEVFAHSVLMSVAMEGDPQLIEEIKEQLRANGLQVKPEIVSKVVTLLFWIYSVYLAFIECIPCCDVWRVWCAL